MEAMLQWLPAIVVIIGVVAIFVRLQESSKATDRLLQDHETRIRSLEAGVVALKAFDEFSRLMSSTPSKGS